MTDEEREALDAMPIELLDGGLLPEGQQHLSQAINQLAARRIVVKIPGPPERWAVARPWEHER